MLLIFYAYETVSIKNKTETNMCRKTEKKIKFNKGFNMKDLRLKNTCLGLKLKTYL